MKLVKSLTDKNIWDSYSVVRNRYISSAGLERSYPQLYFRGAPNGWGTTAMELVADFTWRTTQTFGSADNERFKFEIYGDWSVNFGDNQPDGMADQNGADIPITQGAGSYTITFNDQTKTYSVLKN
jgi:hypothetical protein